ncbi:uncharacterized protein M437DRAFT_41204 [Aureobasidium melanogenum CBS 110374]|uniref:DNA-directed RNA polymerase III subunit n=1 Tax=Aureobasidium melanogenum (strain CBS 110374) TaxID=1043003 RepID=A0A074VYN3_AURM1|nr:uncharacterized protein M437DRAFT_41204 [Aureobasidium melanogenum CBS 110374]KEQ65935.1 hypothetical protein M437DRAFT_41204 [Aureobasidium melanogenum CBS 110374]
MSRGGGWGGGGGKNDLGKMGGQALPWEYDPELEGKLNTKPSEKFPPIQPPIADPPSLHERQIVSHYRTLRARIHDGPFYAILDSSARVHKSGKKSPVSAHYDPFESMPTYSQRYTKKKNTLPKLSSRPFVKSFFPEELWAIIEPGSVEAGQQKRKVLNLSTRTRLDRFDTELDDEEDADADEGEEDKDDNDDYNAEQYFDGGDDDDFGGDDGGGDGDDY